MLAYLTRPTVNCQRDSQLKNVREATSKVLGLIFKGNPKNYLTEIQLPFRE